MLKINQFVNKHDVAEWGLYLVAFLMGTGFLKLEIGALVLIGLFSGRGYLSVLMSKAKNPWLYLAGALLGSLLWLYWWDYFPYKPQMYPFDVHYFKMVFVWSLLAFLLPLSSRSARSLIALVWFMALGAFVYAFVTVIVTLCLLPPPYYGRVIDLRSLIRGVVAIGNTPGISNLLCFVPIGFSAGLLLDQGSRPRGMVWLGLIVSLLAIFGAIQLQQRTFFLLVLVLQPVVIGVLLVALKRYRMGLAIFLVCLIYPALIWLEGGFGIVILPRKLDANLLTDARVEMFRFWLLHVWVDPWSRVEVGPAPWDSLYWFHNFFADVHRLSGLKAMLAAVAFMSVFFIRVIYLLTQRATWGVFLLAVALPIFVIINTSVVPEGEVQPFLMMVLLYSICECLLWKIKKESPLLPV